MACQFSSTDLAALSVSPLAPVGEKYVSERLKRAEKSRRINDFQNSDKYRLA
jgi:hypothetical protein